MPIDIRMEAAKYYDLCHAPTDDIDFYIAQMPHQQARVLELGCGTGRVLVPLAEHCGYIHGLDCSEAMLTICREKLQRAGISADRAQVERADITNFDLEQQFDLITAPYRVMQNLATDAEVDGLFRCIRRHLAPGGIGILNVFRPNADPETLFARQCSEEQFAEEIPCPDGRIVCTYRQPRVTASPLVLYPELIYRRYKSNEVVDEAVLPIAMRCYYPGEFLALIEGHGFHITGKWGGYAGEAYGEGGELVVAFTRDNA